MKVLMICTEKLPVPPIRGGAIQTYISGVAPFLSRKHKLTVLGRTDPSLPKQETINGIRYVRVEGGLMETYIKEVVKFLRKNAFDVIHIFNRPRLVLPVRKVAPNARIVLSMHNDMFGPDKIKRKEAKKAIKEVRHIITVSNYVGEKISELYPEAASKIRTVYSGVDVKRFVPFWESKKAKKVRRRLRRKYKLGSRKIILFVGRISPKKGADVLVRAMYKLKKRHRNPALVIVGGKWYSVDKLSDYMAYVRSLAERSPIPVVTTGYVPADQIHQWFWAGDIFVCTSQWEEPLARVHYEAMAAGLPFVTTRRGGNPEVVKNKNGLVVDRPEDPKAFVKPITKLLSNKKLRREMGKNGRHLALKQFQWKRVAKEVEAVWEP